MKFFGQFSSITRQSSLAKSDSIEIPLTAQVSFTFFLKYCRCFSECKMASKSNWEEVAFIDFVSIKNFHDRLFAILILIGIAITIFFWYRDRDLDQDFLSSSVSLSR
jgi:hypothetical protein